MIGIFFGILCLAGFVAVWRGRHRPGCLGERWGHGRFGRRRYAGRGRYFGLYRLFEDLDTSPGQEKAIRSAVDELRRTLGDLRPRLLETRRSVATALSSDAFDALALEQAFEAPLADVARSRGEWVTALGKIHEALDAGQRRRLTRFVEALPHGPAF